MSEKACEFFDAQIGLPKNGVQGSLRHDRFPMHGNDYQTTYAWALQVMMTAARMR